MLDRAAGALCLEDAFLLCHCLELSREDTAGMRWTDEADVSFQVRATS